MKISDQTKDAMLIVGMCVFLCIILLGISKCSQNNHQQRQKYKAENPVEYAKERLKEPRLSLSESKA